MSSSSKSSKNGGRQHGVGAGPEDFRTRIIQDHALDDLLPDDGHHYDGRPLCSALGEDLKPVGQENGAHGEKTGELSHSAGEFFHSCLLFFCPSLLL